MEVGHDKHRLHMVTSQKTQRHLLQRSIGRLRLENRGLLERLCQLSCRLLARCTKCPTETSQEMMKWQDQTTVLPWSSNEQEYDVQRQELLERPRRWHDRGGIEPVVYALVTFSQRWAMNILSNEKVEKINYSGLLLQEIGDHSKF
jgi:hypothetical protein